MPISKAAKAAYDRRRYLRLGPRSKPKDPVQKAAYDRARYAMLHEDRRPRVCAREGCDVALKQPRRGQRLYCSRSCLGRAFYAGHYVPKPRTYSAPEPLPAAYSGHQWLEMARAAVGTVTLIEGTEISDRYYDDMGEALLALMEGKDPKEAVRAYRKQEWQARYLTKHIGDWAGDDPVDAWHRWEAVMPQTQSAEDAFMETLA